MSRTTVKSPPPRLRRAKFDPPNEAEGKLYRFCRRALGCSPQFARGRSMMSPTKTRQTKQSVGSRDQPVQRWKTYGKILDHGLAMN
jgi:hypothetical protein